METRMCRLVAGFALAAALVTGAQAQQADALIHDVQGLLQDMSKGKKPVALKMNPLDMSGNEKPGQHDCFWMGPVYAGAFNVAYPDGGAVYWPATFTVPGLAEGAYLEIKGSFPRTRYFSVHTYDKKAAPYDHIRDEEIVPDEGSQNPFITGSYSADMNYTLRVVGGVLPPDPAPNTIYMGEADNINRSPLIVRHYIPETPGDESGGAGLPQVTLVTPDGTRISGEDACAALKSPPVGDPKRTLFVPVMKKADFDEKLKKPAVAKNYLDTKKTDWNVFWDPRINMLAFVSPPLQRVAKVAAREGLIPKTSGFYANFDNQYVALSLNEKFGEIVVLEAKMPKTPRLGSDMGNGTFDIRYWSLCSNESLVTTRFSACIYDAQVALDGERSYTIVVSKKVNRPANAKAECGITWLDWGDAGDGAGHPGLTTLLLRNMAPSADFGKAVQDIQGPGLEAATMAEYLPKPLYSNKATFEARGCGR
ncbi:MAG: hypothetical protein AAF903_06685 [Pseudomonadota bacterium]